MMTTSFFFSRRSGGSRRTRAATTTLRWVVALAALSAPVLASAGPAHPVGSGRSAVPPAAATASVIEPAGIEPAGVDVARVVDQVERNRTVAAPRERVGPAIPLRPPGGPTGVQDEPDVAFDGTNFLVVWASEGTGHPVVVAARVTPAGQVLDPAGIALPYAEGAYQWDPSVAFGDGTFLVAYVERVPGFNTTIIAGARIGTDGTVHGTRFDISDRSGGGFSSNYGKVKPDVAFNGSEFFAVWEGYWSLFIPRPPTHEEDHYVVGARISGGTVLDPTGVAIAPGGGTWETAPAVASDGNGYLVTYDGSGDIRGTRVAGDATVLDPDGIAISTAAGSERQSDVVFGTTGYLVAWSQDPWPAEDIGGALVSPAGTVVATPIAISVAAGAQTDPALAFDGTDFVAVWQDRRSGDEHDDLFSTRIGQDGTVRSASGIAVATADGGQQLPAVAAGGGVSLVVWGDNPTVDGDIRGARLRADGTVVAPGGFLVSTTNDPLGTPGSAFNGSVTLVAWRADPRASSTVLAARVRPDGTVLDPDGIALGSGQPVEGAQPAVATDGEHFMVIWSNQEIGGHCLTYASMIDGSTGEFIGVSGVAGSCEPPAVAFDGTNYLAVSHPADVPSNLQATVLDRNGEYLRSFELTADLATSYEAEAAGVDGTVLVAWRNGAVRVSDTGVVTPVALPAALSEGPTAVASDGTGFLVTRMTAGGLVSTRVAADGTVLDPAGIPVSGSGGAPGVAFNGTWLIVWNDRRTTGAGPGVYGARIEPTGAVVHPTGFPIAAGTDGDPAVSARTDGRGWTVAYPAYDTATASNRMYVRLVAPK